VVPIRWIFRVILLITFVTTFQGCRHTGSPEVAPGTTNYPEKNAAPIRQVSIRGTIAPTLRITLSTIYKGRVAAGCYKTTIFSGEIFEGQTNPLQVTVPIPVSREDNNFSAAFEVDRFAPGKCDWHFAAVEIQVSRGKFSFPPAHIIQAPDQNSGETRTFSSSDDPVNLRCRDLGKVLGYSCVPPFPNKSSQRLVDTTSIVNIEVTDDDTK
jgi:hypothetical protein